LSGNRNFEGRIHPLIKSSYLASPPLVVAYALAGTVHIDLQDQPIGNGTDGKPVFLKDLWPSPEEVNEVVGKAITKEMYATEYGKRRGNHEVLIRGTFANIRLRNKLAEKEGWWTRHFPSGEEMTIYDASARYQKEGVPLVVFAGKEYGSGSSRDWAAKGPNLLGVRAVIAESYERIHRSNLLMMGILPLQFMDGESRESLGVSGREEFAIAGVENADAREVTV